MNDFLTIRKTLLDERKMREYVFRNRPAQLKRKVEEIDAALAALNRLQEGEELPTLQPAYGRLSDNLYAGDGYLTIHSLGYSVDLGRYVIARWHEPEGKAEQANLFNGGQDE